MRLWTRPVGKELEVKVMEFLGAPGIGKSTLYRELVRQRSKGAWLTPTEARIASYKRLANSRVEGWYYTLLKKSRFEKSASQLTQRKLRACVNSALDSSVSYQQFLAHAMSCFKIADIEELTKVRMIYDWYNVFTASVLFHEAELDRWVMVDESITKKGINCLTHIDTDNIELSVQSYYSTVPLPDVVMHCFTEPYVAVERILKRRSGKKNKLAFTHMGVSELSLESLVNKQLLIAKLAKDVLLERGSKVIDVDLGGDIYANKKNLSSLFGISEFSSS